MFNQSLLINETQNDFQKWIEESANYVCTQVYFDENNRTINVSFNFTLGEEYFNRNWPLVDQRLAQAGHRLGLLLNELTKHRSSTKISPEIKTLIIALCIELGIAILAAIALFFYKLHKNGKREVLTSE
jgi:hypothetical protein